MGYLKSHQVNSNPNFLGEKKSTNYSACSVLFLHCNIWYLFPETKKIQSRPRTTGSGKKQGLHSPSLGADSKVNPNQTMLRGGTCPSPLEKWLAHKPTIRIADYTKMSAVCEILCLVSETMQPKTLQFCAFEYRDPPLIETPTQLRHQGPGEDLIGLAQELRHWGSTFVSTKW